MRAMNIGLRFAPLIRVSTEAQRQKGESLRTQKKQITQVIEYLGGVIPDGCWKYSGQEHATGIQERKKLDQLLRDSSKGHFDAVIVVDASRWSRDNKKSKEGLQVLRENGIRFFVGGTEYDLFSPEQSLFLGLATEINEFEAKHRNLKSILNRIERAKRGVPSSGYLPFGRTYDKKTETWGVDPEKQQLIKRIADEYISGGSLKDISKRVGMNYPNLLKILKYRSGEKWEIRFKAQDFGIDEAVVLKVPRLLPSESIKAIHQRAEGNRTYLHRQSKPKYLLGRMIFCSCCGYALSGQANRAGKLYYRHRSGSWCKNFHSIPADALEKSVIAHVYKTFGDKTKIEQAVRDSVPNIEEIEGIHERIESDGKALGKIKSEKNNLVRAIARNVISEDEAKEQMGDLRRREALLKAELQKMEEKLENVPSKEQVLRNAQLMLRVMKFYFRSTTHWQDMDFEDKRRLLQTVFAGKDGDGNRLGIYVKKERGQLLYSIRGTLINEIDQLPMTSEEMGLMFGLDDSEDFDPRGKGPSEAASQNMLAQCHAYHVLGLYQ